MLQLPERGRGKKKKKDHLPKTKPTNKNKEKKISIPVRTERRDDFLGADRPQADYK